MGWDCQVTVGQRGLFKGREEGGVSKREKFFLRCDVAKLRLGIGGGVKKI